MGDAEHRLLGHDLNAGGDVGVALLQVGAGLARRPEQLDEGPIDRAQPVMVAQVAHVQAEAAVLGQRDQLAHLVEPGRPAVGRHAHDLVLTFVDLETQVAGECAVQQPERMRVANLVGHLEVDAAPDAERGAGPFSNTVGGDDRGLVERRWKVGAGGVRKVVLAEENLAVEAQRLTDLAAHPQFLAEPALQCVDEGATGSRIRRGVAGHDALELEQRLLVEDDVIEVVRLEAARFEAVIRGLDGQSGVVLDAAETLFLGRCDQIAVAQQASARVVVEAGQAEDVQQLRIGAATRQRSLRQARARATSSAQGERSGPGAAPRTAGQGARPGRARPSRRPSAARASGTHRRGARTPATRPRAALEERV